MTLLNYWHYIFIGVAVLIFLIGVVSSLRQKEKKLVLPMLISVTLISAFLGFFSIFVVDKYTKKVEVLKLKNKRLLSTEQIIYTGIVRNTGNHTIGTVTLEIKLVNKGHVTGNVKAGNFYRPSGFTEFFGIGKNKEKDKPQTVVKEFVVAEMLKPGTSMPFRVHFRFPGYFRSVADFVEVSGR